MTEHIYGWEAPVGGENMGGREEPGCLPQPSLGQHLQQRLYPLSDPTPAWQPWLLGSDNIPSSLCPPFLGVVTASCPCQTLGGPLVRFSALLTPLELILHIQLPLLSYLVRVVLCELTYLSP